MELSLTKRDVARRQLITAIQLFFAGGDLVSTYSLAANAWEVIDVLCSKAAIDSISNQTRGHIPEGRDLRFDYVNSPYRNFFKHADRDPEAVLATFDHSNADSILFLAVEDYLRLYKMAPVEFQVFQLWYLATHVEKIAAGALAKVLASIESTFPNIRALPRSEQLLLGRNVLEDAMRNKEVLSDSRTE